MSKCIRGCGREAQLPDRNRMGRPIKRVCVECHSAALKGDLSRLLEHQKQKRRIAEEDNNG